MLLLNILIIILLNFYLVFIFFPLEKFDSFNIKKFLSSLFLLLFYIIYPIVMFESYLVYFVFLFVYLKIFNTCIFNLYYYFFYFDIFRYYFCVFQNKIYFYFSYFNLSFFLKLLIIFFLFFSIKLSFIIYIICHLLNIIYFVIDFNTDYLHIGFGQNPLKPIYLTSTGKKKIENYNRIKLNSNIFYNEQEFQSLDYLTDFFYENELYNDFNSV